VSEVRRKKEKIKDLERSRRKPRWVEKLHPGLTAVLFHDGTDLKADSDCTYKLQHLISQQQ
jgi:hypothetical protein